MGSDRAPKPEVEGAILAARHHDARVLLVGKEDVIQAELDHHPSARSLPIEIVPAKEIIGMHEKAAQAVRTKRDSSMRVGLRLVREGHAAGFVSAGNTGAAMATAKMVLGALPGVDRPALAAVFPTSAGTAAILLDVGANVDSKPEYMVQFAAMGAVYAREMMGLSDPRVGLLSNGEEEGKGDELVKETARRLKDSMRGFIGNIEPKDLYSGKADVVVADGFVGNIAIKMAEATAEFLFRSLREEIPRTLQGKVGGALIRDGVRRLRGSIDWREFGGAPLLGIDGVAVVAHGRSDARAIKNAIRVTKEAVENQLVRKIRAEVGK